MSSKDIYITFTKRSVPIPPNYRPLYKITFLLAILFFNCRGQKASLLKVQLFLWALKSDANQDKFKAMIQDEKPQLWSLDPTVIRAINFASAERLIEYAKGVVKLTPKGKNFIKNLLKDKVLEKEVDFLSSIGLLVTEKKINHLSKNWAK